MNAGLRGVMNAVATMLSVVFACTGDVEGSDYDQSCATDDDCVLVGELDVEQVGCSRRCNSGCGHAAINKKDKARFDEARASARDGCDSYRSAFCESDDVARCASGTCSVVAGDAGTR